MTLRIAAVQLNYLPAYFDGGTDYLSAPLADPLRIEVAPQAEEIKQWRLELRRAYCALFLKKLDTIVRYCAAQNCRLVVFPEYSVPIECLNWLRDLSLELDVAILAGSSRIDRYHPSLPGTLPELDLERCHRRAIATLFQKGQATIIAKISPSRYDLSVGWDSTPMPNPDHVLLDGMNLTFWICSDYLAARPSVESHQDVAIIVSYTPALGDFVVRIQDSDDHEVIRHAYNMQKQGHGIIFVNGASKGGTKTFFLNRHPVPNLMEAPDGTWGHCEITANHVVRCGIPGGTEGIVITDVSKGNGNTFKQHSVVPIIHCAGPDDPEIGIVTDFIEAYRASDSLEAKVQLLRFRLPHLRRETPTISNEILSALWAHLESNLESIDDEQLLDRFVTVCIVHEEAPGLSAWLYRASTATIEVLNVAKLGGVDDQLVDKAIASCQNTARELQKDRQVSMSESLQLDLIAPVAPVEWLELSGPVRAGIAHCRSGSGALIFAVTLVKHLLRAGETSNAQVVLDQVRRLRSHMSLEIIDDLTTTLSGARPDVAMGLASCDAFLRARNNEKAMIQQVCRGAASGVKGAIIAYGFSDLALILLSAMPSPKPAVFVSECRNRAHIESGLSYAREISALGFPVTYVSDATLGRLMYRQAQGVGTVLMGFTLAGPDGVINTVGSLGVALLAKECGVDLVFVGQSFKIVSGTRWSSLRRSAVEAKGDAWWLDDRSRHQLDAVNIADPKSDLVPWELVGRVVSEIGVQTYLDLRAHWDHFPTDGTQS